MSPKRWYNREEKIAVEEQLTEGEQTAPSLANEYGVHENTIYKWANRFLLRVSQMRGHVFQGYYVRGGHSYHLYPGFHLGLFLTDEPIPRFPKP